LECMILLVALLIGATYILGNNEAKTNKEKELERKLAEMERMMKDIKNGGTKGEQRVQFSVEPSSKPTRAFRRLPTGRVRRAGQASHLLINETAETVTEEFRAIEAKKLLERSAGGWSLNVEVANNERIQKAKLSYLAHEAAIITRRSSKSTQDKKQILRTFENWEHTRNLTLLDQIKLADYFEEVDYPKGAVIIKQGILADYTYIIKSGKINKHTKKLKDQAPQSQAITRPNLHKASSEGTSNKTPDKPKFKRVGFKKGRGKSRIGNAASRIVTSDPPNNSPLTKLKGRHSDFSALPELKYFKQDVMDDASEHESDIDDTVITGGASIERDYGPRKKTLGPGDHFGDIALVFDCRRENSFIALMPCKVWRISRQEYHYAINGETDKKPFQAIVEVLRRIAVFSLFEDDVLKEIAATFTTKKFKGGESIIKKYDVSDSFYIVKSGSLLITNIGLGDVQIADVKGGPGFWFGEGAILTGNKRAADVDAGDEGVEVLEMTREMFEAKLGPMQKMLEKARLRRHMTAMPIFCKGDLDAKELSALADAFEEKVFQAKHMIARPNKKTVAAIYIVKYGEVYVANEKTNTVNRLVGYGHFGTGTMQASQGSTYISEITIKVEVETKCWVLTREALLQVIKSMSRLGEAKSFLSDNLDGTIKMDHIERMHLFGEGTFGKVWLAKHKKTNAVYALKAMSKAEVARQGAEHMVSREKNLLASVDHPLIVDLLATVQDKSNIYMLMKLIQGGELLSVLESYKDGILPNTAAQFYGACIAEALSHLHSRMICHRDLKPQNIVMDEDGYCVLVDFGFAKVVQDGWTYTKCFTPGYGAPEMLNNKGHNWSVDLWALGIMIYEMLVGQNPFDEGESEDSVLYHISHIQHGDISFPEMELHGIEVSADAKDLITKLLDRDVKKRLEFGEKMMRDHPWFGGLLQGQKLVNKTFRAPWVPAIRGALDTSNFESMEDREALLRDYEDCSGAIAKDFDDSLFADF